MSLAPNSLAARDVAYALHGYTNLAAHEQRGPLMITRGEGIYVEDDNGKRYIEGLAGLWCTSLGFGEQRLVDAAVRQMQKLPYTHTFAHRSSEPVAELSEKLVQMAPVPMSKAFLTSSGSEATDSAIKFVWYYNNAIGRPAKKKIIARKRGYHGVTVASASLTGLPILHADFDLPIAGILHTECPHHYREAREGESEEAFASRRAEELEQLILAEGPDTVAAFFAEPVMGAGGVIVPPPTYYEKIQAVLERHDVLLVADEVINGFGRTGNTWGSQTMGMRPDILCCAKQLSSAYLPIGATLISEPIYRAFVEQSERHGALGTGFTYGGHPVSAAVALETLRIYDEDRILDHVRAVMPRFQERLQRLVERPLVGQARGVGLIGAIEVVEDKLSRAQFDPSRKAAAIVAEEALERGLILRALAFDSVAVCPPLIIREDEVDELFDRFEQAVDAAAVRLGHD